MREREDKTANGNKSLLPLPAGGVNRVALDTVLAEARDMSKLLEFFDKNQASDLQHLVGIDGCDGASENEARLDDSAETNVTLGTGHDNYQESDMKPSIFYMPQPMYTELRKELALVYNATDVSGNNVICAFIWKSILRAWAAVRAQQKADLGETATLAIPFDARPDLSHLLPAELRAHIDSSVAHPGLCRDEHSMGGQDDPHERHETSPRECSAGGLRSVAVYPRVRQPRADTRFAPVNAVAIRGHLVTDGAAIQRHLLRRARVCQRRKARSIPSNDGDVQSRVPNMLCDSAQTAWRH